MNTILQKLQTVLGPECKQEVSLKNFTTLKVGGPADLYIEAKTSDQFQQAVIEAIKQNVPFTVLGGGSNTLISDKGIRGLVIRNLTRNIVIRGIKGKYENGNHVGKVYVEADSGVIFNSLVRFTIEEGYKGIEMHLGLPGTVGGAVYMNSKWTNPEGYIGDVLHSATIITKAGELKTVPKEYFHFGYDDSILQKTKEIVVSVTFEFERSTKEVLWDIANRSITYRRSTQPQGVFTLGCTFQNISTSEAFTIPTPLHTTSAGYLIDHAGLKGYTIGNAQVSPIHANFIANLGGATAADIIQLIEHVRLTVKQKFGVELKEEIVRLGEF